MKTKLIIFMLIALSFSQCNVIDGEGPVVSQTIDIENFTEIETLCPFDVYIDYGAELSVVAEGQMNIIDRLKTSVKNNKWTIELKDAQYTNFTLNLYITLPYFTTITNSGSGQIFISDFRKDDINLILGGSGDIICNDSLIINNLTELSNYGSGAIDIYYLQSTKTNTEIGGSGAIILYGQTEKNEIKTEGSGNFEGFDYITRKCDIVSTGAGCCYVYAETYLGAMLKASGNVYYKGYPEIYKVLTGTGNVISSN